MTGSEDEPGHRTGLRTGRMEALSDGVFAIAITLLVLEIGLPSGSQQHLLRAIAGQWPSYLAYLVSFATIGAVWFAHTVVSEHVNTADATLMRINLLLLMMVSFLPFPTKLLAQSLGSESPERVATVFYGCCLLCVTSLLSLLWRYAVRAHLVHADATSEHVSDTTRRITPGLAGYVVLIGLSFLLPFAAVIGYLAVALFILLPVPMARLRSHRRS
jgi:uncharacterized membrane protein